MRDEERNPLTKHRSINGRASHDATHTGMPNFGSVHIAHTNLWKGGNFYIHEFTIKKSDTNACICIQRAKQIRIIKETKGTKSPHDKCIICSSEHLERSFGFLSL